MCLKMFLQAAVLICCLGFLDAECRNGWVNFGNSCYLFSRLKFDFGDAEQFCQQRGGYLVHIETKNENDFIRNFCMNLHVARRWIGIDDMIQEGRWVYHGTDTAITYSDWYTGEPNEGASANCVFLFSSHDYHWADDPCHWEFEPICESALNADVAIVG